MNLHSMLGIMEVVRSGTESHHLWCSISSNVNVSRGASCFVISLFVFQFQSEWIKLSHKKKKNERSIIGKCNKKKSIVGKGFFVWGQNDDNKCLNRTVWRAEQQKHTLSSDRNFLRLGQIKTESRKKKYYILTPESFGLILQNLNFICVIETVESYLGLWEKRANFSITIAEIQQKVRERIRKRRREKMLNFGNVNTEIPLPNSCCPGMKCAWSTQSEKKKKFVTN